MPAPCYRVCRFKSSDKVWYDFLSLSRCCHALYILIKTRLEISLLLFEAQPDFLTLTISYNVHIFTWLVLFGYWSCTVGKHHETLQIPKFNGFWESRDESLYCKVCVSSIYRFNKYFWKKNQIDRCFAVKHIKQPFFETICLTFTLIQYLGGKTLHGKFTTNKFPDLIKNTNLH